jgi:hypothetical protein
MNVPHNEILSILMFFHPPYIAAAPFLKYPVLSSIGFYSPILDFRPFLFFGSLSISTHGRTPWTRSARRKASTYTGQHNTERRGQTSMTYAGFETVIQCTSGQGPRLRPRGHWIGLKHPLSCFNYM